MANKIPIMIPIRSEAGKPLTTEKFGADCSIIKITIEELMKLMIPTSNELNIALPKYALTDISIPAFLREAFKVSKRPLTIESSTIFPNLRYPTLRIVLLNYNSPRFKSSSTLS